MALLDFSSIAKLFKNVDMRTLTGLLKTYDENKEMIDMVIGLVMGLINKKDKTPIVPDINTPPTGIPIEPKRDLPKPVDSDVDVDSDSEQIYYSLKLKCMFLEGPRNGGNRGELYNKEHFQRVLSPNGPDAQMVGDRMHFDNTPYDNRGREIGPNDPRHPGIEGTREKNQYTMDMEWTYDGEVMSNSGHDIFALESSWDDFGHTPVLLLEGESAGRKRCTMKIWIKPEYNGGVKVESNEVVWYSN